jgi:hypothetical protein
MNGEAMINPNEVESQDSFVRSGGSPPENLAWPEGHRGRELNDLQDLIDHALSFHYPDKQRCYCNECVESRNVQSERVIRELRPTSKQYNAATGDSARGVVDLQQAENYITIKYGISLPQPPSVPKRCGWWKLPSATFFDPIYGDETITFRWYGFDDSWTGHIGGPRLTIRETTCSPSIKLFTPMRQIVVKHSLLANDECGPHRFQKYQFAQLGGDFGGGERTSDALELNESEELKHNPTEDKTEPFEREPKRFHISLKRFDSHGNPIQSALSGGVNATNSLPVGWFNTFPAGDTRPWTWDAARMRFVHVDPIFSNDFHPWWLHYHTREVEGWLPFSSNIKQANESAWSVRDRKIARVRRVRVRWPNVPGWTAKQYVPKNYEGKKYAGSALFFHIDDLERTPEGYAARKKLHLFASEVLRETKSGSKSVYLGNLDPIDRCGRCGCSFFTRDNGGDLRCRDCNRYHAFEFDPEHMLQDEDGTQLFSRSATDRVVDFDRESGKIYDPNGFAWRRVMTEHEFLEAIILSGQMSKMYFGLNLRKNAGSRMILVDGWLPEDVALLTGEPELTIKTRADRLYTAWREHRDAGKAVTVTAQDVLSHKLLREQELQRFDSWADSIMERHSSSMPQFVGQSFAVKESAYGFR